EPDVMTTSSITKRTASMAAPIHNPESTGSSMPPAPIRPTADPDNKSGKDHVFRRYRSNSSDAPRPRVKSNKSRLNQFSANKSVNRFIASSCSRRASGRKPDVFKTYLTRRAYALTLAPRPTLKIRCRLLKNQSAARDGFLYQLHEPCRGCQRPGPTARRNGPARVRGRPSSRGTLLWS